MSFFSSIFKAPEPAPRPPFVTSKAWNFIRDNTWPATMADAPASFNMRQLYQLLRYIDTLEERISELEKKQ